MATRSKKTSSINAQEKDFLKSEFEKHLRQTLGIVGKEGASQHEKFLGLAYTVRDQLIDKWVRTQETYYKKDVKRVYYLSLEFLIGRTLGNSIVNLDIDEEVRAALDELGLSLEELREAEVDAGLGNGGLGRLAACFIDSMATLEIPAYGMGIRYEYGMFRQTIENGYQKENPDNWLRLPNPWEIARPQNAIRVPFGGRVDTFIDEKGRERFRWVGSDAVIALPYDTPVPGYKNNTVNNLRLWSAKSADEFGLEYFNSGDYLSAVRDMQLSENISKVLYPNDSSVNGKELRLKQQFFLCCASLSDLIRRHLKNHKSLTNLPEKVAVQLNDTHPAIAIPEMMRLLLDEEGMDWDTAWAIVEKVFSYTNHTLMPEALERWSVGLFERLLPRHLQIIYEINARFLRVVALKWPGDNDRLRRMSLIEEGHEKSVRMAYLSIVGSHKVNGVAALHTDLLKAELFKDFNELWPEKFNNKTNGVTQRRWMRKANPALSALITSKIGDNWVLNLDELKGLEKFADDKTFQKAWKEVKHDNKVKLAEYLLAAQGAVINPNTLFDVQVKRIHEYKRQLMPCLFAIHTWQRIKNGDRNVAPRTILIGGKAAPGYWMAKQIIKLITAVGDLINNDPDTKDLIQLHFIENYRVSAAEKIFPASDLSEQVSTAGTEASGTGNMKFAMNGALIIGTLDGANVEIKQEVGDENIFIFGKVVEEVQAIQAAGYKPWEWYEGSENIRKVLDLIASGIFSPEAPHIFRPILDTLIQRDPYLVLADFDAYLEAQAKVDAAYRDQDAWTRMSILNVARMGFFSTDRTIAQYNQEIWGAGRCPIEV